MIEQNIQTGKRSDAVNLTILLAVALCIGIYLIASAVVMAKDGVTFINFAQQLELDSAEAISKEYQHPGFPYLILAMHKMTDLFYDNASNIGWVYCGQGVALLFRLMTVVVLYYIGKQIVGGQCSFWSVLILLFLPELARYGSDVLSDWPHLFFLSLALLILMKAAGRWWAFGIVGLVSGCGYLIRPECSQLVLIGVAWLGIQFIQSKRIMGRPQLIVAFFVLCLGFGLVAGSYMKYKGAVLPKKSFDLSSTETGTEGSGHLFTGNIAGNFSHVQKIASAIGKFLENAGETFMWFFILPLFLGMLEIFRRWKWIAPENFFIFALTAVNIPVMIWLHYRHGYMSQRHTMPLFVILSLYVACGLQIMGDWLKQKFPGRAGAGNGNDRFWFLLLAVIGITICMPKLLSPIRSDKQGFRAAAKWIKANTVESEPIAVPDTRISFYADRSGVVYMGNTMPADCRYIVSTSKKSKSKQDGANHPEKIVFKYNAELKRETNVAIYQILQGE